MKCLLCSLPFDMDHPLFGRIMYWHINRVAQAYTRDNLKNHKAVIDAMPPWEKTILLGHDTEDGADHAGQ
jgi:hypothetical protein